MEIIREITPMLHFLMVLFVTTLVISISIAGFSAKRFGYLKQFSSLFGVFLLLLWIVYNIYYFLPTNFRLDVSLPLHACDILAIIASLVLIKPSKKASALLYFCALALAGQAIITPVGNQDPMTFRFWLFWLLHAGIISASIFDLVVQKYHPIFKDFLFIVGCELFYVAFVLPLNIVFGWNYGYIGNTKPDTTTIIDALGTWPQRLIWIFAIIFSVQFIIYLPWKLFGGERNENERK